MKKTNINKDNYHYIPSSIAFIGKHIIITLIIMKFWNDIAFREFGENI